MAEATLSPPSYADVAHALDPVLDLTHRCLASQVEAREMANHSGPPGGGRHYDASAERMESLIQEFRELRILLQGDAVQPGLRAMLLMAQSSLVEIKGKVDRFEQAGTPHSVAMFDRLADRLASGDRERDELLQRIEALEKEQATADKARLSAWFKVAMMFAGAVLSAVVGGIVARLIPK